MRAVRLAEIPAYRGLITDRRGESLGGEYPSGLPVGQPSAFTGLGSVDELG